MKKVKVCCCSDLHGQLLEIPECDLLIISGDICPDRDSPFERCGSPASMFFQSKWLGSEFKEWLDSIPAKEVVACYGNHDYIGQRRPDMAPKLRWHMLTDQSVEVLGLKIYGSPWQPYFYDWAFNAPPGLEGEAFLSTKWQNIPDDTDVIVVHGPPQGYGDVAPDGRTTGSPSLTARIFEIKPKLVVSGHIHSGYGQWTFSRDDATVGHIVNASVLDESYRLKNKPIEIELYVKKT
jgi:Icc-related predicted phosphoesterase